MHSEYTYTCFSVQMLVQQRTLQYPPGPPPSWTFSCSGQRHQSEQWQRCNAHVWESTYIWWLQGSVVVTSSVVDAGNNQRMHPATTVT